MSFPLIAALSAIIFAQFIKYPIALLMNRKSAHISLITSTGGMPSSHSAAVTSLTTALILEYGFNSPYVAIASIFGVIIMFDSMGVRRQSGEQGIVLDVLARHYIAEQNKILPAPVNPNQTDQDNPVVLDYQLNDLSQYERMTIRRYFGHKPSEVISGTFTGAFVAIVLRFLFYR